MRGVLKLMSRWHDKSLEGLARWGNLPVEAKIADRLADLMFAADEILGLLGMTRAAVPAHLAAEIEARIARIYDDASALMVQLPPAHSTPRRDAEVAEVLDAIAIALERVEPLRGTERDVALGWVEAMAAPYALIFYYEVCRLDEVLGVSFSRPR
jgi:hypothetical protein